MADIAKADKAARVAKEAVAAAEAEAVAKLDREAKGQDEKGNINKELQRKEEEQKQASQRTAQDAKNKEEKKKSTLADKTSSPRHPPTKRKFSSPASTLLTDMQDEEEKSKLEGPPKLNKKLLTNFEAGIGDLSEEKYTGFDANRAYTSNNVKKDNETGRYIVADAKFVTESVEMDFGKEGTSRNKLVLFQKVNDHMKKCNETSDNPDNERFAQIVKNFNVSNLGHIFSRTGYPNKNDHPEFIAVKKIF